MIALIQRVSHARVEVQGRKIASIGRGIAALVGIEKPDSTKNADRLLQRITGYRIFPDDDGKMNLSLADIRGELLLVPQFTLPADTGKGMRPGFSRAAPAAQGTELFQYLLEQAGQRHPGTGAGVFGADMQLSLTNEGPVTFWLQG